MPDIQTLDPCASPPRLLRLGAAPRARGARPEAGRPGLDALLHGLADRPDRDDERVPTREFAEALDQALRTDGLFSRLVGLVLRSQLPSWFRPYADMEAKAAYISTFQSQVVYGLLQTKAYARALLGVEHPHKVDEMVAARLERQRVLKRENSPVLWVVLSEAALLQEVGGRDVMREQLARLLEFQDDPWVNVQVLPFSVGQHTAMMGSFNLLRFDKDPDLFYVESYDQGHMTANPSVIKERSVGYARLQATALSPEDSATVITRVMEERYGNHS